jgi:hypothetical protein
MEDTRAAAEADRRDSCNSRNESLMGGFMGKELADRGFVKTPTMGRIWSRRGFGTRRPKSMVAQKVLKYFRNTFVNRQRW